MKPIRVISSMPGSGKTSWVFGHMRSNQDERWIFVSPYLKECGGLDTANDEYHKGRIREELPEMDFQTPTPQHKGGSKSKAFKELLKQGHNISTTHQLWKMMDSECAEIIHKQQYKIVIDESLNLVETYEEFDQMDLRVALHGRMIIPDGDDPRLIWNDEAYPNYTKGKFMEIKHLCEVGALYLYGQEVVIHQVPPQAILAAKEVIVLTYGFKHSIMGAWCEVCRIPYEIDTTVKLYKSNEEIRQELLERINLIDTPKSFIKMNEETKKSVLTKSWFEEVYKDEHKKEITSSLKYVVDKKFDKGNIFWTTFKDYKDDLKGKRYTRSKTITLDGRTWKREPFVAKNMRASNEYRDCTNCIYLVDVRVNPYLKGYLSRHGARMFNENVYSLLEMLQFIFRGAIRNKQDDPLGNHLNLFIGSPRMKRLLEVWLEGHTQVD